MVFVLAFYKGVAVEYEFGSDFRYKEFKKDTHRILLELLDNETTFQELRQDFKDDLDKFYRDICNEVEWPDDSYSLSFIRDVACGIKLKIIKPDSENGLLISRKSLT